MLWLWLEAVMLLMAMTVSEAQITSGVVRFIRCALSCTLEDMSRSFGLRGTSEARWLWYLHPVAMAICTPSGLLVYVVLVR